MVMTSDLSHSYLSKYGRSWWVCRKSYKKKPIPIVIQMRCLLILSIQKWNQDRKEIKTSVLLYLPKTLDVIANMSRFDQENFKKLELNVKFDVIPKTRLKKFNQHFKGYTTGLVQSEPGKFVFTPLYAKHADRLYRMQPRTDDVWLLTFPKCGKHRHSLHRLSNNWLIGDSNLLSGTTWTSELLWLVMNNFDTEKATSTPLIARAPFIEYAKPMNYVIFVIITTWIILFFSFQCAIYHFRDWIIRAK